MGLRAANDPLHAGSRVAIVIPARFGSTRFPGKPLAPLRGAGGIAKPLIERSWEAARAVVGDAMVWIATDDSRIVDVAQAFGGRVVMTPPDCRNGTERCWRAIEAAAIDAEIIVNLQGDAPLTPPLATQMLIDAMLADSGIAVATPMIHCSPALVDRLRYEERCGRAGGTTVVFDGDGDALYFSKRVIPHVPDRLFDAPVYLHLGLYAYRRTALERYLAIDPPALEQVEGLEQLRFLHAGVPVRMIEIPAPPGGLWEVNHPSDIVTVEAALAERQLA